MTERVAIIDLGSNSARLIVMHIYHNGAYNLVYHQKESVRLSEGMDETGMLTKDAMGRAIGTLKVFAHMCEIVKVDKILAVATAAVRNAKNGGEFINMVASKPAYLFQLLAVKPKRAWGIAVSSTPLILKTPCFLT